MKLIIFKITFIKFESDNYFKIFEINGLLYESFLNVKIYHINSKIIFQE